MKKSSHLFLLFALLIVIAQSAIGQKINEFSKDENKSSAHYNSVLNPLFGNNLISSVLPQERRVSAYGDFLVVAIDLVDPATGKIIGSRTDRKVVINGVGYNAIVSARRAQMTTKFNIPLQGTLAGNTIILDDEPARIISANDSSVINIDRSKAASETVVAEIGGQPVSFPGKLEYDKFIAQEIAWEMQIGPVRPANERAAENATSTYTEGAKKNLYMRVDFSDKPGDPFDVRQQITLTPAVAENTINNQVNKFLSDNSYGKTTMQTTVTPVLRMPKTLAEYARLYNQNSSDGLNTILTDARTAARAAGYETNNYDSDLVAHSTSTDINFAGLGWIGAKGLWLNGYFDDGVIGHEYGHNLGLNHANRWKITGGIDPIGPGENQEYGDWYDRMGGGCYPNGAFNSGSFHFNAAYKRKLDWLTDANVQTVTTNGTYRVFAHDITSQGVNGIRALKIVKNASVAYWVELRQLLDTSAKNGALIHWYNTSTNTSHLLDMTPTGDCSPDEALLIGQSLLDSAAGVKITILGKGNTSPESLDVQIQVDAFTSAPTSPSNLKATAATSSQVNLTWDATPGASSYDVRIDGSTVITGITSPTYSATNLSPNATHTFEVRGVNSFGASDWSTSVTASTAPPSTLKNVVVRTTGSTQAFLSWNTPPASEGVTGFEARINNSFISAFNFNPVFFNGLSPNANYTWEVRAISPLGASAWSTPVTISTGTLGPATKPTNVIATPVTGGRIDVAWTAVATATSYNVRINGLTVVTGLSNPAQITGLAPNTTYSFEVQAQNAGGMSDWSTAINATTPNLSIPSAPTNVSASVILTSQINVAWNANSVGELVTSYNLRINGLTVINNVTSPRQVTNLTPNTTYQFEVQAVNAAGGSNWSAPISARTNPLPPGTPTGLAANVFSSTQINWAWAANPASDSVTGYNVRIDGSSNIVTNITNAAFISAGLASNTNHTLEVQAVNAGGVSAWSASITARTRTAPTIQPLATYIGEDNSSRGNWVGSYGADGKIIIGDGGALPAYAQLDLFGQNAFTWAASSTEARALRKATNNNDRIAATYYTPNQMFLHFDLTDGQSHRLALYVFDWDGNGRVQTFDLLDPETGTVLDTRTISGFNGGKYVAWNVRGRVTVRVRLATGGAPPNAVLSGIFFDAANTPLPIPVVTSATYVGEDEYTKGNWVGNYGAEGKTVLGDAAALPAFTQLNVTGQNAYTWVASTTDARALRKISNNADRIASTFYTPTQMDLSFDFTDGIAHRLTLYALDWDTNNTRVQTFELVNTETGAVLDTKTISSFSAGRYVAWTVKGKVTVRVKKVAGPNAVLSGIFVDAAGTNLPTPPPVIVPSAVFVGADTYTKGNWVGNYGADGVSIIGDGGTLPAYAQLTVSGQNPYTWVPTTADTRALRKATNTNDRIASTFYTSNQMDLNFDLTDGQLHRMALYALDWEGNGRVETFELINTETGAVLDTKTISTFGGGRYLVWTVKGKVTVRIKNAGGAPPNAVISGIFFDTAGTNLPTPPPVIEPTASFVGADNYTHGNWVGNYGADGKQVIGDGINLPVYAQLNVTGQNPYTWVASTTDVRALKKASNNADRIASTYYTPNQMDLNFDLVDGQSHRMTLYALDWEGNGRRQTFELVNTDTGAILDTRTVSGYNGGLYMAWTVKGKFTVRIKNAGGSPANAVLSGIFFDAAGTALPTPPPPDPTSAAFVRVDTNARGNWLSNYGGQGYSIVNDATSLPAYAQLSVTNQNAFSWVASTTDVRALIKPANQADRIAATYYAPTQFELNFNLTDGNTHRIALYALDWEGNTRQETFELVNTDSGAILDTRTIANFNNGVYVVWDVRGKVTVRVKKLAGANAVLSGVFFDSLTADDVTTGSFVGTNTTAQGNWQGVFGSQGRIIPNLTNSLPTYARMTAVGTNAYTWNASTTDVRAFIKATNPNDRIASTFYTPDQMELSFYFTDEQTHKLSIYNLDWDTSNTRTQTLELVNSATGAVIDTRTVSSFSGGIYTTWNVKGKVTVRVKKVAGPNAVISGVFIDN